MGHSVNFAYRVSLVLLSIGAGVTSSLPSCNRTTRPRGGIAYHCIELNSTDELLVDATDLLTPSQAVRELHVTSSPIKFLDPSTLSFLRGLRTISWTSGELTKISIPFPETLSRLEVLNISRNHLHSISPDSIRNLGSLRVIDLSHNNLSRISNRLFQNTTLKKAHLLDNPWNCSNPEDMLWMLNSPVPLADLSRLVCGTEYPGRSVVHVLTTWQKMDLECPKELNCTCWVSKFVPRPNGGPYKPVVEVNCSNQGLAELPEKLPTHTISLDFRNNKATDLTPLLENEYYKGILVLYLDNNNIHSINMLEGSHWLSNFRLLSLNGNKLNQLPTYMLDNALEKNHNVLHMYLGNNPWRCDCISGPILQTWIAKNQNLLKDIADIKCAEESPLKHVSGQRVASLSRSDVCQEESSGISTLDIVNVLLASLIVLVLGKLIYDYWSFRRTGELPWLVSKMP